MDYSRQQFICIGQKGAVSLSVVNPLPFKKISRVGSCLLPVRSVPSLVGAPGTGYVGVCCGRIATALPAVSFSIRQIYSNGYFYEHKSKIQLHIYTHTYFFPFCMAWNWTNNWPMLLLSWLPDRPGHSTDVHVF